MKTRPLKKTIGGALDEAVMQSVSNGMLRLTDREIDILNLYLSGATRMEMSYRSGLHPRVLEIHRLRIKKKLGVRSVMMATIYVTAILERDKRLAFSGKF